MLGARAVAQPMASLVGRLPGSATSRISARLPRPAAARIVIGRLPGPAISRISSRLPGPAAARIVIARVPAQAAARFAGVAAGQPKARIVTLTTVIVTVLAGTGTYALTHDRPGAAAGARGRAGRAGGAAALRVLSVTPGRGARRVNGAEPVQIAFSAPLAAGSPMPALSPSVAGSWQSAGKLIVFTPAVPLRPDSRFTVTIPAGRAGVRATTGGLLARTVIAHFSTRAWAPRRLAELLAQLGYLPLSWHSDHLGELAAWSGGESGYPAGWSGAGTGSSAAVQAALAYSPPTGKFRWDPGYPAALTSLWQPGTFTVILRGAVMAFESEHQMAVTGVADQALWDAVFRAAAQARSNRDGYTFAIASKGSPETLTIWHDGQVVLDSAANTGIPVAPTADGTFPVYLRYLFQIMHGTNPDGSSYADPVSFVAYFNGGEAVHYFPRGSYGFQQSLGCVELPYAAAEQAWPYLTYGSLVTVSG
jgi:peptidoglycan hydrolase-like protein with peptidoglycan-binding domain